MAKKKKRRRFTPVDPFLVFYNARSFQITATVLWQRRTQQTLFLWPIIVNESLSLELHLKCLHMLRRRRAKIAKEHRIRTMFEGLSKSDRAKIIAHLEQIMIDNPHYGAAHEEKGLLEMDSILDRADTMFVDARYWHEGELPRDKHGRASSAGIGPMADAVQLLILELRPDWTEEKMGKFRFKFPGIPTLPN